MLALHPARCCRAGACGLPLASGALPQQRSAQRLLLRRRSGSAGGMASSGAAAPAPRSQLVARAQAGGGSHAGKAALHDFCMTIPYGGIALLSGLVALLFKAPTIGVQLAGAGALVTACSVLSLRAWKAGGSSAAYTLVSAGASGWIAYQMWQRVAASVAPVPSGILLALSAALAAFCLYNILAGGNPPRQHKAA